MSTRTEYAPTARTGYEPAPVPVRLKIAGLWTAMLFVFAYVDVFSLYRADVRADLEAGRLGGFAVGQAFLLVTTVYVVVPALMVFLSLVLPARAARIANLVLAGAYALTIAASAIGEGNGYYLFGSAVEVALLAGIAVYAWTWPKAPDRAPAGGGRPPA
jgi:hypothetical protein